MVTRQVLFPEADDVMEQDVILNSFWIDKESACLVFMYLFTCFRQCLGCNKELSADLFKLSLSMLKRKMETI